MSVRGDWWRARAITALNKFASSDTGTGTTFGYSMAAGASGVLNGWNHSYTLTTLTKLLATRNPDGGYGVGVAWDAFDNGTVNPADTTYTVSLAGHAGPTLLDAYRNSSTAVTKPDVQAVINMLTTAPKVATDRGDCLAYSLNGNDSSGAVHNVNAGVGAFLSRANGAGFGATGMQKLITNITICELVAYHEDDFWWSYLDDGPIADQDPDHNSYQAESMYSLAYWVGREVAYRQMAVGLSPDPVNAQDPIAHTRLTGLAGGPGSWAAGSTTVTLWAVMGDAWKTEQENYLDSIVGDRAAQFAYYAARNSRLA